MIIPFKDGLPRPDLGEWQKLLERDVLAPSFCDLTMFLEWRREGGAKIYPAPENIFRALKETTPEKLKVVILGQDPYHKPGQAHGLSFSVPRGIPFPPSLRNILAELDSDVGGEPVNSGDLSDWATQGVLLLNTLLTVEEGRPLAHKKKGWEKFTNAVIKTASDHCKPSVFVLWGSHAQEKKSLIDTERHLIMENVHPSPLSAHRGFFGHKPFSQINAWLKSQGRGEISWKTPRQ